MALPHTKFVSPRARPEHLPRPRQLEQIDPHARLLLLSAPAGYGKTTLVGQWIAADPQRATAWVQLGPEDDGVYAFWIAILSGLHALRPPIGQRSLAALAGPVADIATVVLTPLVIDLCEHDGSEPLGLVLDDFHAITDPACHTTLAWFIERAPASMRIAIATRSDPVLPLGRMRAHGELSELRAADLRFDDAEVARFFNGQLGLELAPDDVAALARRTEGWPAGLYLAALSLRGVEDRAGFVAAFAGDDMLVVDYLVPEIMGGLAPAVRSFLTRTSILDGLTAALCDAVLELPPGRSDEVLSELERTNMFLVSLDRRRRWFRYHLLFRDLLRRELERDEPELVGPLHRRAAGWHQLNGNIAEAITHDLAGGDLESVALLIASAWLVIYQSDNWPQIEGWLAALPERDVARVPGFLVAKAWMAALNGDADEAARLAPLARAHDHGGMPLPDGATSTESALATIEAFFIYGDVARARAAAQRAAQLDRSAVHAPSIATALGVTAFWSGLPDGEVRPALERAVGPGGREGASVRAAIALAHLAYLDVLRGDVDGALREAASAVAIERRGRKQERPLTCAIGIAEGWAQLAAGAVAEAEATLARALELARAYAEPLHVANALALLAECHAAAGDATAALVHIEEAEQCAASCADPGFLRELVARSGATVRGGSAAVGSGEERAAGEPLSERELQVLQALSGSLPLPAIASELFVSHNTVKTHCKAIYRKLGVRGRSEAVAVARATGVLQSRGDGAGRTRR